jgi:ankyrin repeat domain-containing protein 50
MSTSVTKAPRLTPDVRLAQAVSEFEADLSREQKAEFRTGRSQVVTSPPTVNHVMALAAEINQRACEKSGIRRCFGPRFTFFLEAVQQFAALGDIIVGGSQNLVACGVWSAVRMSLLVSLCLPSVLSLTSSRRL